MIKQWLQDTADQWLEIHPRDRKMYSYKRTEEDRAVTAF